MEKKESPKKEDSVARAPKIAGFSHRIFAIIKLVLGIGLLSFVYSTTRAFVNECGALERTVNYYFIGGIITFLVVYLFMCEPAATVIYNKGQKIVEAIFRFFSPLVRVAPYLLPIYTLILFFIYALYSIISKSTDAVRFFVLLFGFSIALHLVLSAKSLRSRQGDFLKANYIFGFSVIYIINLAILAFGFSLMFSPYSFINFCNNSFQIAKGIFSAILKQLFL